MRDIKNVNILNIYHFRVKNEKKRKEYWQEKLYTLLRWTRNAYSSIADATDLHNNVILNKQHWNLIEYIHIIIYDMQYTLLLINFIYNQNSK